MLYQCFTKTISPSCDLQIVPKGLLLHHLKKKKHLPRNQRSWKSFTVDIFLFLYVSLHTKPHFAFHSCSFLWFVGLRCCLCIRYLVTWNKILKRGGKISLRISFWRGGWKNGVPLHTGASTKCFQVFWKE